MLISGGNKDRRKNLNVGNVNFIISPSANVSRHNINFSSDNSDES